MDTRPPNRSMYTLAAVGAGLAALYWGAFAILMITGAAFGLKSNGLNAIMPFVLVGLYAWRAVSVMNGDRAVARRLIVLHAIGIVFAAIQISQLSPFSDVDGISTLLKFQYGKIAVNVFGAVTAFLAQREG